MNKIKKYVWSPIGLLLIIAFGFFIFYFVEQKISSNFYNEKLITSEVVIAAVNHREVADLAALLPGDIYANSAYTKLKEQFVSMGDVFLKNGIDSIYLLVKKSGDVYFMVESTPEGQPLYVTPGKIYEKPPVEIFNTFNKEKSFSSGVYTDEYGTYTSQFSPVFNSDGNLIAVLGVDIDYTYYQAQLNKFKVIFWIIWFLVCIFIDVFFLYIIKSRKLKKAGLISEQKIMSISNAIDDAIVVVDSKSEITFWNKTSEKIFGHSFEQAIGYKFKDLVKINEIINTKTGQVISKFELSLNSPFINNVLEIKLAKNKKNIKYYELHFAVTLINEENNLVAVFHDITNRKAEEAKLEEQKSEMEKLNSLMIGRELKMIELKKKLVVNKKD